MIYCRPAQTEVEKPGNRSEFEVGRDRGAAIFAVAGALADFLTVGAGLNFQIVPGEGKAAGRVTATQACQKVQVFCNPDLHSESEMGEAAEVFAGFPVVGSQQQFFVTLGGSGEGFERNSDGKRALQGAVFLGKI